MQGIRQQGMPISRPHCQNHQRQHQDDSREKESISLTRPPPHRWRSQSKHYMCKSEYDFLTPKLGQELYSKAYNPYRLYSKKFQWIYEYRHTDGELFSATAPTLELCRQWRDEWLAEKKK